MKSSLILVMDCYGNSTDEFDSRHPELQAFKPKGRRRNTPELRTSEAWTAYLQDGSKLKCVEKEWQDMELVEVPHYGKGKLRVSDGLGRLYEAASEYIFNSCYEPGKVMGLAAYGKPSTITNRRDFILGLDWSRAFKSTGKRRWEDSPHFSHYADIAASVQAHFESSVLALLSRLQKRYRRKNLIFAGGSALNCIANMQLLESGLFKSVFVPPFPGDEGISLGAAAHLRHHVAGRPWRPTPLAAQTSFFGVTPKADQSLEIATAFKNFKIERPDKISTAAAQLLNRGAILGWFQGASESGPRALGHRSILADPRTHGLKNRLNSEIKNREAFRPYGCSCLWEEAHRYFHFPKGADSAFMSFAPRVRSKYSKHLQEVTHTDGTARIQTVRYSQDARFYDLIQEFSRLSGLACVLNTSMNVMGEPIVESVADAARFFSQVPVDAIVVDDCLITRRPR